MPINNIKVHNFTVFSDFEMKLGNGINLIIGENGIGKTHLLKIIYSLIKTQQQYNDTKKDGNAQQMSVPKELVISGLATVFDVTDEYLKSSMSSSDFSLKHNMVFQSTQTQVLFIPSKEMLSHARGLTSMKKKYGDNMPFDATLLDIIEKAQAWKLSKAPPLAKSITPVLERVIGGVVEIKEDCSFWIKKTDGKMLPFSMEADGHKLFGLLWQLIMNENITSNSVILWDEPENSINPENIPVLVESIIELQRHGVQLIMASHSYNFVRYFDVLRNKDDSVKHFCLYKSDEGNTVNSWAESFRNLVPNPIDSAGERLYKDAIGKAMEDA